MALDRDDKGRFVERNICHLLRKVHAGGITKKYGTPDELLERGFEYFEWADDVHKGKYAYADLRLFIGFLSRNTWKTYKDDPLFQDAIYILESIMEGDLEKKLMWAGSTQGAIFKLKNKFQWTDEVTQHQNITGKREVIVIKSDTPLSSSEAEVKLE